MLIIIVAVVVVVAVTLREKEIVHIANIFHFSYE